MSVDKRSHKKSATLIARMYPETKEAFKKYAEKKGITMNDLVTDFIEKTIKENAK